MSDLISRSAVCAMCGAKIDDEYNLCSDECLIFLGNVPSVDAVEVVRCQDCKNYSNTSRYTGKMFDFYFCTRFNNATREMDFCSYGERKDNDSN